MTDSLILYAFIFIFLNALTFVISRNRLSAIIYSLFFALAFGFRVNIGHDFEQYVTIFQVIARGDLWVAEPGYYLLNNFFYGLFDDDGYYGVFFICSFLSAYFIYRAFSFYEAEKFVTLFLFLSGILFFMNNGVRQGLVISGLLYFHSKYRNNSFLYSLSCIFLSMFHYTALLFLIIPMLKSKRLPVPIYIALSMLSFVFYTLALSNQLLNFIVGSIPYYGGLYLERIADFKSKETGSGIIVLAWYLIGFLIIFLKDYLERDIEFTVIVGLMICLSGLNIEMWERTFIPLFYLSIFYFFIILHCLFNKTYLSFLSVFVVLLLLTMISIYQISNNANKNLVAPFEHLLLDNFGVHINE